jgi:hypothetical protein
MRPVVIASLTSFFVGAVALLGLERMALRLIRGDTH